MREHHGGADGARTAPATRRSPSQETDDADPTAVPKVDTPGHLSAAQLTSLQRLVGNESVTRMLGGGPRRAPPVPSAATVQRGILPGALRFDKGTPEQIEAAIKSKDPADVKAIESFEKADPKQRFELIDILLTQDWLGVFDRNALDRLWAHYDVETLEGAGLDRFRRCVERGWKPGPYKYLTFVDDFKTSMKQTAITNLTSNLGLLQKEAHRLGASDPEKVEANADSDAAIREQQDLALLIKDAKTLMARARNITVGFSRKFPDSDRADYFNLMGPPVKFSPDHKPVLPQEDPIKEPNPAAGQMPWETVYQQYATLAETVTRVLSENPALYVLTTLLENAPDDPGKGGEPGRLNFGQQRIAGFETLSAVDARKKVATAMVEVYNNAKKSLGLVLGGEVNPLQFDSLVGRHKKGELGPKYATPFGKWAIDHAIADAESSFDKTMETLGLVLLLASVAIGTAGAGTPLLGAVLAAANVGTAAAGAAMKTFEAENLKTLSESSAGPQGETVSQEKAARAQLDAMVYQFSLIVAVGGEGLGLALAGGKGAVSELTNLRSRPPAEQVKAVVTALEHYEVSQVALRTGLSPEELQAVVKTAGDAPGASSALGKINQFLFGGPINAPTAGGANSLRSLMRKMRYTFRELLNNMWGIAVAAEDRVFLVATHGDAELVYVKLIEDTPGREAAIYRNTATGEHAAVQGRGNWSGGSVSHAETATGAAQGTWILVEHYHPERNFAVQFPSGANGDFGVLLYDYGETNLAARQAVLGGAPSTTITQRVSARIRYRNPDTGTYHFTTYGYDPTHGPVGRFFITVETKGGGPVDYSFHSMAELQSTINRIKADEPIVRR